MVDISNLVTLYDNLWPNILLVAVFCLIAGAGIVIIVDREDLNKPNLVVGTVINGTLWFGLNLMLAAFIGFLIVYVALSGVYGNSAVSQLEQEYNITVQDTKALVTDIENMAYGFAGYVEFSALDASGETKNYTLTLDGANLVLQ
jgi:hypothetical protein